MTKKTEQMKGGIYLFHKVSKIYKIRITIAGLNLRKKGVFNMMTVIGFLLFILWLWALIDLLRSEFGGYNKIIWLLVVILLPVVGLILYFLIGRNQKISRRTR